MYLGFIFKATLILFVSEFGEVVINNGGETETDEQYQIRQEDTAAA
jgi:hypothetical protein